MFLVYLIAIGYLGITMYLANNAELTRKMRDYHRGEDQVSAYDMDYTRQRTIVVGLLYGGVFLIAMFAPYILMLGVLSASTDPSQLPENTPPLPEVGIGAVILGMVVTGVSTFGAFGAVSSTGFRDWLAERIGTERGFDPTSIVHITAVVLTLLLVTGQIVPFLALGGPEGLAQSIEQGGINPTSLLLQMVLQVAASFLGVGWAIRRDAPQALARLGLRIPTLDDLRYGVGIALLLMGALFAYSVLLTALSAVFSDGAMQEMSEANEVLTQALATLPMALLVATTAAIGEELLFRGALQPVFGNILVSIVFALLHTQNLLSLGVIFLFMVSYVLGWLRDRHSTTAAIIAHFLYNFIQLALATLAAQSGAI